MKILFALTLFLLTSLSPVLAFTPAVLVSLSNHVGAGECQPDLSGAIDQLTQAQAAFGEGDTETGIAQLTETRQELELQEAVCINYAPETAGDKRSNPVPLGQRQSFELATGKKASAEILDYVTNASDLVDEPAPDGQRYVVIYIRYHCEASVDENCDASVLGFKAVGSRSTLYDPWNGYSADRWMLFGGGQADLEATFLVGEDETDIALIKDNGPKGDVFFATE